MTEPNWAVRTETAADHEAVEALHRAAFETSLEAKLVAALREQAEPTISLVAETDRDGGIVGHIFFSPVTLTADPDAFVMGLGPMAAAPERQRCGIGSTLVRAGLAACEQAGCVAVVVLGHAAYYPRFGFVPASRFGIASEYDVPDEVFLAQELRPDALRNVGGTAVYHSAFAEVGN